MVRRFLSRFLFQRTLLPRITTPLLPTARLRPPQLHVTSLTNTPRSSGSRLFHHFSPRLTSSPSSPNPSSISPPDASLSQRLKHLIKTYGWYALGVYVVLSVLDFGIAFAGVNILGAEQVSRLAASVRGAIDGVLHSKPPEPGKDEVDSARGSIEGGHEGLYAMLVLAYTIHKTLFVPVRVGLTAALTPKLVGWLSRRGWAGGAGTRRAATEMRAKLRGGSNRD